MLILKTNTNGAVKELIDKLKMLRSKKLPKLVAVTLRADQLFRIHNLGLDSNDQQIGEYSTKPLYVNPNQSPRKFSTAGKNGKSKFKNGNPKKTRYFANGYKGFRGKIGRKTNGVNLSLTGKLSKEYGVVPHGGGYAIGFLTPDAVRKAEGNEERFQTRIWAISPTDRVAMNAIINDHIKEVLRGAA